MPKIAPIPTTQPTGRQTRPRELQPAKAPDPIETTLDGIEMDTWEVQKLKALSPIGVTPEGIDTWPFVSGIWVQLGAQPHGRKRRPLCRTAQAKNANSGLR